MILGFSMKNFYSFKEENTVSFIVNKKSPCTDAYFTTWSGKRVTKILACFGKNASGKTNLLKVLSFLKWFIRKSFDLEGKIHRYVLQITLEQVINESLYIRDGKGFKYLFKREWNEGEKKFYFSTKNFGLSNSFGEFLKMRKNASTLSIALQHNHEESKKISQYFSNMCTNVQEQGREDRFVADKMLSRIFNSAEYFHEHEEDKTKAEKLLKGFDLGLSGIKIEERELGVNKAGKQDKIIIPFGVHVGKDEKVTDLPFYYESSGTQNLFIRLTEILPILAKGGIAILDEFEVDLHPHMIPALLNLFISPKSNPHNAQLLFSCHSIELMKTLDKYQILLVDKDKYGYSEVIRMDEMKGVRSDENIYAKYDAGAYGAVPNI